MQELDLNQDVLEKIKKVIPAMVRELLQDDLIEIILYGSCARGTYSEDSDVDIALLTKCNRVEAKKYMNGLAVVATKIATQYFVIVNFVCLPYEEFENNKNWYMYFKNINCEGVRL